jgi:TonB family protein
MISKRIDLRWVCLVSVLVFPLALPAQSESTSSSRRIVARVEPTYPLLARNLGLAGAVRVEALVGPEGSPRAVDVKGGHPVLAQAVVNAVKQWKWEPAPKESRETVEVKFSRD